MNTLNFGSMLKSLFTPQFGIFVTFYYLYYIFVVGLVTSVAVYGFKIDYSNVNSIQLKREFFKTLESYSTNALCYWIILQVIPEWSIDIDDLNGFLASFIVGNICFNAWFYVSHRIWHSNRIIYKYVHAHHHQSKIVNPLTALNNAWLESVWTSVGFTFAPLMGFNNVWGWYLCIFYVVFVAVMGHSRLPFTLEHASHHAVVNKNYGFFAESFVINYDKIFHTWKYASDISKIAQDYYVA